MNKLIILKRYLKKYPFDFQREILEEVANNNLIDMYVSKEGQINLRKVLNKFYKYNYKMS